MTRHFTQRDANKLPGNAPSLCSGQFTAQAVSGMQVARALFGLWYGTFEPVVSIALMEQWTQRREGESQGAKTPRDRVPMRGTGTDRSVGAPG
jgi:hypothetical protein